VLIMVNHIITKPKVTARMYISKDKKFVVTETIMTDKRPIDYYTKQLLPEQFNKNVHVKKTWWKIWK
jgi:hypothetical protein